jgi:DNA-binding CsgD family transcriptional regulator
MLRLVTLGAELRKRGLACERDHTVQQIADIFGVNRGTLYGHLDRIAICDRSRATR